jgi:hypothetical protein
MRPRLRSSASCQTLEGLVQGRVGQLAWTVVVLVLPCGECLLGLHADLGGRIGGVVRSVQAAVGDGVQGLAGHPEGRVVGADDALADREVLALRVGEPEPAAAEGSGMESSVRVDVSTAAVFLRARPASSRERRGLPIRRLPLPIPVPVRDGAPSKRCPKI